MAVREAVRNFYMRLDAVNPAINAVCATNRATIIARATALDNLPQDDPIRKSRLFGLPVLVKDVLNVKGYKTTLGNPALAGGMMGNVFGVAKKTQAGVVDVLEQNGAVIVGKTNIPKDGLDVQTFNDIHGVTNNPWNPELTAGGSSGGSAAAVAAGLVPLAIGTDLAGSLRIPSAFCGTVSLRSTPGRVPFSGHTPPVAAKGPASESTIVIGGISKDLDILETFMAACGAADGANKPYTPANSPNPSDIRVVITPEFPKIPTDARIVDYLTNVIPKTLSDAGINVEVRSLPESISIRDVMKAHMTFSQRLFIERGSPTAAQLDKAVGLRDNLREAVDDFLNGALWMLPVCGTLPFPHNFKQRPLTLANDQRAPYWNAMLPYVLPATVTSIPVTTLAVDVVDGSYPLGVQVCGSRWEDEYLVGASRVIQNAFDTAFPKTHPAIYA